MTIEIVDFPMNNVIFHSYVSHDQGVVVLFLEDHPTENPPGPRKDGPGPPRRFGKDINLGYLDLPNVTKVMT